MNTSKSPKAAPFKLESSKGGRISLSTFKGSWVVLYFYPKDATSGCTREAVDFSSLIDSFKKHNAVIIGISPDSSASHNRFIEKNDLSVTLLSDPDHSVLETYGVWQKKSMYGREYYGVVRTTLLIDPNGKIQKRWDKVTVQGHAQAVLDTLIDLQKEQ